MTSKSNNHKREKAHKHKFNWEFSNKNVFLILLFCTFILYGKSLFNQYALDDELVTYNNKTIEKGFCAIPEIFTSFYAQNEKMQYGYRPIVQTTFAIEYGIFGQNPFISHLINLLIYSVLLYILFILLKKVFNKYNILFPLFITLLFMTHPVHAEVVCSLKNRDELLSFLGGIAAVYLLIKYTEINKLYYFLAANICLWLGFFSKLSALTFLGIIPLSLFFFTDISHKKNLILSGSIAFVLLLLFYFSRSMLPEAIQPFSITENPLFIESSLSTRFATGMLSLFFYLKLLFFPHPLLFFYGYDMLPNANLANAMVWISLVIHIALFIYALYKIKEKHPIAYALFFYFISISMFTNMATPVAGIVGERFAFAASLGFCIWLIYFLYFINKIDLEKARLKNIISSKVTIFIIIILILYGFKTIQRNAAWYNHKTLFNEDISYLRQSAKANSLLAGTLFKEAIDDLALSRNAAKNKDKVDSALMYYKQSIDVYPMYSPSWNNSGSIYFVFYQDYQKAIPFFIKAVEADSNYVEPYFNLGYSYELTGDTSLSVYYYTKTLSKDSSYLKALSNLSKIAEAQGQTDLFFNLNKSIIKAHPASDVPYINISNHYLQQGDTIQAVSYMELALEKAPSNKGLIQNLIIYYQNEGNIEKTNYYNNKLMQLPKNQIIKN